jgi:hypothetical protein
MLTRNLGDRHPGITLLQDLDDLGFGKSGLPHAQPLSVWAPESLLSTVYAEGKLTGSLYVLHAGWVYRVDPTSMASLEYINH